MSNPTKLKQKKTGMSPEAKNTLGNAIKGVISNQCCVDGGKDSPWWVAFIFLCISVILPLIPIMVNIGNTKGSASLSGYSYGVAEGMESTFKEVKADGQAFKVSNGLLTFGETIIPEGTTPLKTHYFHGLTDDSTPVAYTEINFDLYITDKRGGDLQQFVSEIGAKKYKVKTTDVYIPDPVDQPDPTNIPYTPSYLVLAPETMVLGIYKHGSTTFATGTYAGLDWWNTCVNDLISYILVEDNPLATYGNYLTVVDNAYLDVKGQAFQTQTLIYFGVFAGLILFLGCLVFVLTRGKNNVFSYLSFFKCQRIAWWASFTPALLGMVFGFIFKTNILGQMSFVIFLALRIMWMSMRQLRPVK